MTDVLVLDAAQAEKVRGVSPSKAGHILDPRPTKDGRFILGPEVLDDPAHEDVRPFLSSLSREPIEKLSLYGPDDALPEAMTEGRIGFLVRRLPDHALDEAKPDALTAVDGDGVPREP